MEVNVSPDMGMYNLLRSQGYDTSYALAEFVDNAIHAFQMHGLKPKKSRISLKVTLNFFSMHNSNPSLRNSIQIVDNGPGIARNRIEDAFKPARPTDAEGLSEFGIGMKAAAVWFSEHWKVITCPDGDETKYEFTFNLAELLAQSKDVVVVEQSAALQEPKGTELILSSLRKPIDRSKFDEICNDLKELYQKFTEGSARILDLSAVYDGTPVDLSFVTPPDRQTLVAPIYRKSGNKIYAVGPNVNWLVPVSFVYQGTAVAGQIRLLTTGSYKDNPGIVLFRYNRVISGITRVPYIPEMLMGTSNKYGRQRIYGELFMDGLPVSYTKDKFEIDEVEFLRQLKAVPEVENLIRQANDFRINLKPDQLIKVKSEAALSKLGVKARPLKTIDAPPSDPKIEMPNSGKGNLGVSNIQAVEKPIQTVKATPNLVSVLDRIKSKTDSVALKTIIEETIYQYNWRRGVAAALCLRIVIESGTLEKIRRDFPTEYAKVSDKGIKALINHMKNKPADFFDPQKDKLVIKCVESNASGTQTDILLLNNVAHGHYRPTHTELDKFVSNLEQLINWAYS